MEEQCNGTFDMNGWTVGAPEIIRAEMHITPTVVGVYRDWPGSSALTCSFEICNFHFHYGSNLTSSGIQVKSMQNTNCTLKIVGKYYISCVLYAKMHFTNCPCSSFLLLNPFTS